MEIKNKIIEIIIKVTQDETVKNNRDIDLLEEDILDSLAFIEFITELEEEFHIEIQPTQIPSNTWRNVEDITKMVKRKIEEKENKK